MRLPRVRKLARRLFRAAVLCLCAAAVSIAVFTWRCPPAPVGFEPSRHPADAAFGAYTRPEEDTFLTYPEWFIVWSYHEKAEYQAKYLPSRFPYFESIGQYWRGYCCANRIVRGRYPFNFGDHLMLAVIGSSFSLEYGLKGAYEKTIGFLSEWSSGFQGTDEDRYAAGVAKRYAEFVHIRPFYEFPFFRALGDLWKDTRGWGPHPLRKWERKLWLSLDYVVEGTYCGLMELSSHAVYGVETDETRALVEGMTSNTRVRRIAEVRPGVWLISMPRYQEFTEVAAALAREGVRFLQIAGNEQILVTAVTSGPAAVVEGVREIFEFGLLTQGSVRRIGLRVPVVRLSEVLQAMPVEHVYDY